MKTSNKIILGLFTLPLLVMLLIWGTLYAKIKNNDFITEKQVREETQLHEAQQPFQSIDLSALQGDGVQIEYGAQYSVSFERRDKDHLSIQNEESVLQIRSNGAYLNSVTIRYPSFSSLRADTSHILIRPMKLPALQCWLGTQSLLSLDASIDTLRLDMVKQSEVNFEKTATVNVMHVKMENGARLQQHNADIKQLGDVQLADSSEIYLDGKTLRSLLSPKN